MQSCSFYKLLPQLFFFVCGVCYCALPFNGFASAFPLFRPSSLRKSLVELGSTYWILSSMKPFSHEYNNSFLKSGFIVLVWSTILLMSLANVSLLVSFQRAFSSDSDLRAFALSLSLADSTSDLNIIVTSLLIWPFLSIFTLSRD